MSTLKFVHYAVFTAVLILITAGCHSKSREKNAKRLSTIVTVEDIDEGAKYSLVSYMVNGVVYREQIDGWDDEAVLGEKFVAYFYKDDPSDIEVDFAHPVFEVGEETGYATGKIVKIKRANFLFPVNRLKFKYRLSDNEIIEKWIDLPDSFEKLYPNLREGELYNVEVFDRDVYRVILRLDLPIKKTLKPAPRN